MNARKYLTLCSIEDQLEYTFWGLDRQMAPSRHDLEVASQHAPTTVRYFPICFESFVILVVHCGAGSIVAYIRCYFANSERSVCRLGVTSFP